MPVLPLGQYSTALYRLRDILAASEVFRLWSGAPSEEEAKEPPYIYIISQEDSFEESEPEKEAKRPFALIGIGDEGLSERTAEHHYNHSGTLQLEFEAMETPDVSEADIFLSFMNGVGLIMEDLERLSGTDSHLYIASHSIIAGPGRPSESKRNAGHLKVMGQRLSISWSEH